MALSRCAERLPRFRSSQSSEYQALDVPFSSPGEVGDHAPEGRLDGIKSCRTDLQPFDDAGRERHRRIAVHHKPHQGRPFATPGFQPGKADGADGEGMKVRDQQLVVAEIDPRRLNGPGHQFSLVLEVVTIVGRKSRAVCEDEGSLATSTRPA